MKKAQMETFGLMIIVIILVVIALIVLRFMLINNVSSNYEILSIKANNLANSIKKADLCNGNFENAIVACCNKENFCEQEACNLVSKEILDVLKNLDENSYVQANDFKGDVCFSAGSCLNGINAGKYELSQGVELTIKVCRK